MILDDQTKKYLAKHGIKGESVFNSKRESVSSIKTQNYIQSLSEFQSYTPKVAKKKARK